MTHGPSRANALELRHVGKRFGDAIALDDASLAVRPGTLHAVLGENGAGKTTLMRVAFGMLEPDAGDVTVDGTARRFASPADAIAAGIGMVHQHFTIVPAMTVAENVALGGRGLFRASAARARVRDVAERTGLTLDPDAIAGALGVSAQQRLEIVKALARDAHTLILDEPTAVLTPPEARELLAWLRRFVDDGHSVVLVTHRLRDALAFADDVTVLRRGKTVGALPAADATERTVAELVLGEAPSAGTERRDVRVGETIARATDVTFADPTGVDRLLGVTMTVRAGEIVGIAAVEGAGQHELLRLLAGRLVATGGRLERPARVGFIPEDRHRDALLLDAPAVENVALHRVGTRRGLMPWRAIAARTTELVTSYDVRGVEDGAPVSALSGGNQQKLIVARELAADGAAPPLLVAENPTRGLDVRATAAVHDRLRAARDAGTGVVVHSTDLDEVLALSDRVLVLFAGRLGEVPMEREAIGRAMLGASGVEALRLG